MLMLSVFGSYCNKNMAAVAHVLQAQGSASVTSPLLGLNILFCTLFSNTLYQ
jgi:hypothetical protein